MTVLKRAVRNVEAAQVQRSFDDLLDEVNEQSTRVVVERDGKVVAALISATDLERLEALDRRAAEGFRAIQEIWARNADLDPDEAERDIAEAVAEMRAEARAKKSTASRT
jgi:prevent-host-death family protein